LVARALRLQSEMLINGTTSQSYFTPVLPPRLPPRRASAVVQSPQYTPGSSSTSSSEPDRQLRIQQAVSQRNELWERGMSVNALVPAPTPTQGGSGTTNRYFYYFVGIFVVCR